MNSRSRGSIKKALPLQTFTYYIPAPPHRNTGYREREFDKIMSGISAAGFSIEDIQVQGVNTNDHAGLFIVALVRPMNKKAQLLDAGQDMHENFKLSHAHSSPDIVLEDEDDE